jgi:hypothetical protein
MVVGGQTTDEPGVEVFLSGVPVRQVQQYRHLFYPMPPLTCACLIVDALMYTVTISSESLLGALDDAGIQARWSLPSGLEQLQPGQVVLEAKKHGRRPVQMKQAELRRVCLELVDLPTWVQSVNFLLETANESGRPWPNYRDEWRVWA